MEMLGFPLGRRKTNFYDLNDRVGIQFWMSRQGEDSVLNNEEVHCEFVRDDEPKQISSFCQEVESFRKLFESNCD
jgi:hypothetical protein